MSIASEITRLQNAKSSLKTAIEGKGVTVPSDTTLDGYAALVGNISQGPAVPTFGGLEIAPGPLCYIGGKYGILQDWNHSSYGSVYGKTEGSTYFNFLEMGELFEKADFSNSDGSIENLLDPFNGWRLPTFPEWKKLTTGATGQTRDGSSVNGVAGKKYAIIQLKSEETTYATSSSPLGLLLFPDNHTMTIKVDGSDIVNTNNGTANIDMTIAELNDAISQGCAFLPGGGWYNSEDWSFGGDRPYYPASHEYNTLDVYVTYYYPSALVLDGSYSKTSRYFPICLVRSVQ
jgi:hypothetical protein